MGPLQLSRNVSPAAIENVALADCLFIAPNQNLRSLQSRRTSHRDSALSIAKCQPYPDLTPWEVGTGAKFGECNAYSHTSSCIERISRIDPALYCSYVTASSPISSLIASKHGARKLNGHRTCTSGTSIRDRKSVV